MFACSMCGLIAAICNIVDHDSHTDNCQMIVRENDDMQASTKSKGVDMEESGSIAEQESVAEPASPPQHRWRHQRYRPLHHDGADSPFNADSSDGSL